MNDGSRLKGDKPGVVAFAFTCISWSTCERRLGSWAESQAKKHLAPLYTQIGIPIKSASVVVSRIDEGRDQAGRPPPTLRVCRGAVDWALERDINVLHVVCAIPHTWRVLRDIRFAIREKSSTSIRVELCKETDKLPYPYWFDAGSPLWWTRGPIRWHVYNAIMRVTPMWFYTKIAK